MHNSLKFCRFLLLACLRKTKIDNMIIFFAGTISLMITGYNSPLHVGDDLYLSCHLKYGDPEGVKFKWLIQHAAADHPNHVISNHQTVTIKNITKLDAGVYTCVASTRWTSKRLSVEVMLSFLLNQTMSMYLPLHVFHKYHVYFQSVVTDNQDTFILASVYTQNSAGIFFCIYIQICFCKDFSSLFRINL